METVLDLCSGYGGLSLAWKQVRGGQVRYYSEIDEQACRVYDANHDGVVNLGDLRARKVWPKIDVVLAGFPCQPASQAGKRKGTDDHRWLWPDIAKVVGKVRPSRVLLENVPGLRTVNAGMAIHEVLHGLAGMGFHARWGVVRASDAGACHRRARWFCEATTPDADESRLERAEPATRRHMPAGGRGEVELLPTPKATYPGGTAERYRERLKEHDGREGGFVALNHLVETANANLWDRYGEAISRHEHMVGRHAPDPVFENPRSKSGVSLAPEFVEWMMGLDEGWVCGVDIPRTSKLRILGNGVVWQQAALALELLEGMR